MLGVPGIRRVAHLIKALMGKIGWNLILGCKDWSTIMGGNAKKFMDPYKFYKTFREININMHTTKWLFIWGNPFWEENPTLQKPPNILFRNQQ